jgi:CheY-like chemotaxis protein
MVSRQLVELMGGRIGATPSDIGGGGFWFSVELPDAGRATVDSSLGDTGQSTQGISDHRNGLVLLAEDDEVNRVVGEALLAKLGLRTEFAHDGQEAIKMAACNAYDAILMDCMMPGIDGLAATREIRTAEGARRVPIIAVTALAMPGDRERLLGAGMDDYLSKPVRLAALDAVLTRWLPASSDAQKARRVTPSSG